MHHSKNFWNNQTMDMNFQQGEATYSSKVSWKEQLQKWFGQQKMEGKTPAEPNDRQENKGSSSSSICDPK